MESDKFSEIAAFAEPNLPFSQDEIAQIRANIKVGKNKTEVVKAMPRYTGRLHNQYVGYYEMLKEVGIS